MQALCLSSSRGDANFFYNNNLTLQPIPNFNIKYESHKFLSLIADLL